MVVKVVVNLVMTNNNYNNIKDLHMIKPQYIIVVFVIIRAYLITL